MVTCCDVVDLVEAIAAGDLDVGPDLRGHFESCPPCAAALALARRTRTAPAAWGGADPPPDFASAVLARVRRERWSSEQRVDRIFNVSIALALLVLGCGALVSALLIWG